MPGVGCNSLPRSPFMHCDNCPEKTFLRISGLCPACFVKEQEIKKAIEKVCQEEWRGKGTNTNDRKKTKLP